MTTLTPLLYRDDIDQAMFDRARADGRIAWDIETTGLDWSNDRIGTCQLATGGNIAVIQIDDWTAPDRLRHLLEDPAILKVFHHAPFDLRFMAHHWKADPANVACTKIASKVLNPGADHAAHSLKPVLKQFLGVVIDKTEQRSDWIRPALSDAQVAYAATDVLYLSDLYDRMMSHAVLAGVDEYIRASYQYLPTRVKLDLAGSGDVFAY
jgi:ribonuclease D